MIGEDIELLGERNNVQSFVGRKGIVYVPETQSPDAK
jgi:hypothetical protein